jgi:hypothetical protein
MTTNTITCVIEDIPFAVPKNIVDLNTGLPALLPAGNSIYEIEVRLTGNALINPSAFAIGLFAPVAEFSSYNTFSGANVNTYGYISSIISVQFPNQHLAVNTNTNIQALVTGAQTDTTGKLYIVVKYKPLSIGSHSYQ